MEGYKLIDELVKKIYDGKPSVEQLAEGRKTIEVGLDKAIYDSYSDEFSSRYTRLVNEVEQTEAFFDEQEQRQLSIEELKKIQVSYEARFREIKERVLA